MEKEKNVVLKIWKNIVILKTCCKKLLGHLADVNLFTLKFYMIDHIVEDLSKFGDLSYLEASLYEHFIVTVGTFIKMTSMRKTCTMNKSVNVVNPISSSTEKLCSSLSEKRRCSMSWNGTIVILDREVNTICTLMQHETSDGRAALKNYITETIKEEVRANCAASMPAKFDLNVVNSLFICGGSNVTMKHYNAETVYWKKYKNME